MIPITSGFCAAGRADGVGMNPKAHVTIRPRSVNSGLNWNVGGAVCGLPVKVHHAHLSEPALPLAAVRGGEGCFLSWIVCSSHIFSRLIAGSFRHHIRRHPLKSVSFFLLRIYVRNSGGGGFRRASAMASGRLPRTRIEKHLATQSQNDTIAAHPIAKY